MRYIRTNREAELIETMVSAAGKLPEPVKSALDDYRAKFDNYQKAQTGFAAAKENLTTVKAEQSAAKSAAAKQALPDPTNPEVIAEAENKLEYARLSLRETADEAARGERRLAAAVGENAKELFKSLKATYAAKLKAAEAANAKANKILNPAYSELADSLSAIKTVALMSSARGVVNQIKDEKPRIKAAKLTELPDPQSSKTLLEIERFITAPEAQPVAQKRNPSSGLQFF